MPSSHLILCHPLLLLPPIPPSIRAFSNQSTLRMRQPKYWSFSFSISPSNEHPGLIFRIDQLDLLGLQGDQSNPFWRRSALGFLWKEWCYRERSQNPNLNTLPYSHLKSEFQVQFSSVQSLSRVWLFATPCIAACQASLSITKSRIHSNSHPSSQWCHPAISSSVVPFSSCPQSLPASEPFPMSQLFAWGGQSTGVSAFTSFLPKKPQRWSPSEWPVWISLQSKGFSRVFSYTTIQKHQFSGAQLSSQSNSNIHTWPLEKP